MPLRVILALVCAAGLCAAQSESTPAPQPAENATAKDAAPVAADKIAGDKVAGNQESAADKSPAAAPTPAATNQGAPAPPTGAQSAAAPVIDVPPARKNNSPSANEKGAKGARALAPQVEADNAPYLIGALDVLGVKVWGQPNLSGPVDVAAEGTISLPLIGDVKVEGLTREQVRDVLTRSLSDFLNNPEVDVQVLKNNSKRYYVYGGVGRPGEFPLQKPTTVMDAISLMGGFRDFTNTKKIRIQRMLPSGEIKEFMFNWKDVSKGKHMEENIYLQNGDRIFVPE